MPSIALFLLLSHFLSLFMYLSVSSSLSVREIPSVLYDTDVVYSWKKNRTSFDIRSFRLLLISLSVCCLEIHVFNSFWYGRSTFLAFFSASQAATRLFAHSTLLIKFNANARYKTSDVNWRGREEEPIFWGEASYEGKLRCLENANYREKAEKTEKEDKNSDDDEEEERWGNESREPHWGWKAKIWWIRWAEAHRLASYTV